MMVFVSALEQNDTWKRCRIPSSVLEGNLTNDADRYDSLCLGLSIFQGSALSFAMLIYISLMVFIFMKRELTSSMDFCITYSQICLMLFMNHLSVIIGFIISPCRFGSIQDETSFEIVCITLSTIRLFTIISSFSWKVLEHVYIQFRVAKEFKNRFDKNMNDNQKEKDEALKNKMLEKKRQMFQRQNSESSISSNRVKRTFSRDIFMIDRGKIRSRQNERLKIKGILTSSEKRGSSTGASISVGKLIENLHGFKEPSKVVDRDTNVDGEIDDKKLFFTQYLERWHIKIFLSPLDPTSWKKLVVGYIPAGLITLVCSFIRAVFVPVHHHNQTIPINHTNVIDIGYWSSIKGLDVYCSAGTETTFLYDMIPIVVGAVLLSSLFYIKSDETVFLCRKMCVGDYEDIIYTNGQWIIDRSYRKMTSISRWAKERPHKRSSHDDQLIHRFKLKQKLSSSLLFVMVTTWIIECLQTLLIWGMCVPYSSICLLQAITIAVIVPNQVDCNKVDNETTEKGWMKKILCKFGLDDDKDIESDDDVEDWYI